jgi:hypothetical protein
MSGQTAGPRTNQSIWPSVSCPTARADYCPVSPSRSRFPAPMYTQASERPLYNRARCANLDDRYCCGVTYRDRGSCQRSLDVIGFFVEVEWDRMRGVARALECMLIFESGMIVAVKRNARILHSAREVHLNQLSGDLPSAASALLQTLECGWRQEDDDRRPGRSES